MNIHLQKPTLDHEAEIRMYVEEFLAAADKRQIPGAGGVEDASSYSEWVLAKDKLEYRGNISEDGVLATQFIALDTEDRIIGFIQLRHRLNESLRNIGGHISYSIRPSERRKGYGSEMLRLCLGEAAKLNITSVLVTCDATNAGSEKVIRTNGGILENTCIGKTGSLKKRFWIHL
jgi:predicted acetyltransferase